MIIYDNMIWATQIDRRANMQINKYNDNMILYNQFSSVQCHKVDAA